MGITKQFSPFQKRYELAKRAFPDTSFPKPFSHPMKPIVLHFIEICRQEPREWIANKRETEPPVGKPV